MCEKVADSDRKLDEMHEIQTRIREFGKLDQFHLQESCSGFTGSTPAAAPQPVDARGSQS